MSRFKVEQCCFDIGNSSNAAKFKADPDGFLASYPLTVAEKEALEKGDLGALYKMGATYGAIWSLARAFNYDGVAYIRKLREAAGLPENKEQMEIMQKRANRLRG